MFGEKLTLEKLKSQEIKISSRRSIQDRLSAESSILQTQSLIYKLESIKSYYTKTSHGILSHSFQPAFFLFD